MCLFAVLWNQKALLQMEEGWGEGLKSRYSVLAWCFLLKWHVNRHTLRETGAPSPHLCVCTDDFSTAIHHTHTHTWEQVLGFLCSPFRHCLFFWLVVALGCCFFQPHLCVVFLLGGDSWIFESMMLFPLTLPRNCRVITGAQCSTENRATVLCLVPKNFNKCY